MREILFKAKRKDSGEWVKGYFFDDGDTIMPRTFIGGFDICINEYGENEINGHAMYEVIPETVGQYTGLKDKNGKSIVEGDVVVWTRDDIRIIGHYAYDCSMYTKGTKFQVIINEAGFMLARLEDCMLDIPNAGTKIDNYAFWNNSRSLEIIGNTHDSTELLGE